MVDTPPTSAARRMGQSVRGVGVYLRNRSDYIQSAWELATNLGPMGWAFLSGGVGGVVGLVNDMGEGDDVILPPQAWALLVCGCFAAAAFIAFHRVRVERDSYRASGANQLRDLYERGVGLMNTWESGHPAGPEAHQADVRGWSNEVRQVLREHYSIATADQFDRVQPLEPYPDSPMIREHTDPKEAEYRRREFLLLNRLKMLHGLLE